jgi:sugar lactone lactonase YvrE
VGQLGGFIGGALTIAEGSVWAAEGFGDEKVHRLDPVTGKIVASIAVTRNPSALAYGAGAIWVSASAKVSKAGGVLLSVSGLAVLRIDPVTNQVVASVQLPTPEPPANAVTSAGLVFANGAVWACDTRSGTVVRIEPAGERVTGTIEGPRTDSSDGRHYSYFLYATGDRLVLTRYGFKVIRGPGAGLVTDVTVWQIDPETNRHTGEPVQLVRDGAILAFVDGVAWLGNSHTDGLTRVDPIKLQPSGEPLLVGHPVYAIAGDRGSLLAIAGAGRTAGDDRKMSRWRSSRMPNQTKRTHQDWANSTGPPTAGKRSMPAMRAPVRPRVITSAS